MMMINDMATGDDDDDDNDDDDDDDHHHHHYSGTERTLKEILAYFFSGGHFPGRENESHSKGLAKTFTANNLLRFATCALNWFLAVIA